MDYRFSLRRLAVASAVAAALGASGAVFAQGVTIDFANTRGTGVSQSDILIENVRVSVPVTNPFDPSTSTTSTATYNVTFRFDPVTLHLVPVTISGGSAAANCASAQVTVVNAVQGTAAPLSGASVTIGTQTATTNSQGVASFSNLAEGIVSIAASASNYTAALQTATLGCTGTNNVTMALSPAAGTTGGLTSGQFRVILTWGQNPSDLDSHLTGPDTTDPNRWHVYYSNKSAGDICGLDVDDQTSYGPETVTCPRTSSTGITLRPGIYRYSVHHYTGSGTIGASGASVRLEFGNGTVYTYTPPESGFTGSKDVWTVFELTANTDGTVSVAPVNTISNVSSASSVRSRLPAPVDALGYGRPEDGALFRFLSK